MKEVLNGGYNVHPVPPPNSEIKERITKRYERERIKIEKLFTLGYTTSGDPWKIGKNNFQILQTSQALLNRRSYETHERLCLYYRSSGFLEI